MKRHAQIAGSRRLGHICAAGCLILSSSCALFGYEVLPLETRDSATPGRADASSKPTMDASSEPTMDASSEPTMDASSEPFMDASNEPFMDASNEPTTDADDPSTRDASMNGCVDALDCGLPLDCADAQSAPCDVRRECDASASCGGTDIECTGDGGLTGPLCSTGICQAGVCETYFPIRLERPAGAIANDLFGDALALKDGLLVIGAPYDDVTASDGGAAYVYRLENDGNWVLDTALTGSLVTAEDHFGEDVDLDGQWMVIGADHSAGEDSGAKGSVYIFRRTGPNWTEFDRIPDASDPVDETKFGNRVAVHGDWILVTGFTDTYLYHYDGTAWTFARSLNVGKASRLAIEDTTAVLSIDTGTDGQVFVYDYDGSQWSQSTELISDDDEAGDLFGRGSVALQGDTIAVSAHMYRGLGPMAAGAVYVFERDNDVWSQTQRLQAPQPAASEEFGTTIALDGQRLAIGVPLADTADTGAGAVDVFVLAGASWVWQQRVLPSQPTLNGNMGTSDLKLSGRFMVFSSEETEVSGAAQAGAVEVVLLN